MNGEFISKAISIVALTIMVILLITAIPVIIEYNQNLDNSQLQNSKFTVTGPIYIGDSAYLLITLEDSKITCVYFEHNARSQVIKYFDDRQLSIKLTKGLNILKIICLDEENRIVCEKSTSVRIEG